MLFPSHDPERGVKFKTYAEHRIKGAVLDEVRKMIGDERCKTKRPRKVDFDYTLISDNLNTQRMMESDIYIKTLFESLDLDERERGILECRALGMNLREISEKFEFSESRASQILAKIKKQVFVHYKDELDIDFDLIEHTCPTCGHVDHISSKAVFVCEPCNLRKIEEESDSGVRD